MKKEGQYLNFLKIKYPVIDRTYLDKKGKEEWEKAIIKLQNDTQEELKKAETDQLRTTKLRDEARLAIESKLDKDSWKTQKLANI